jgi:hypothetical protein
MEKQIPSKYGKGSYKQVQKPYDDEGEPESRSRNPYMQAEKAQRRPMTESSSSTERFMGQIGNVLGDAATALPAGAVGAAIGGLTGGPMGAVAGGVGAATGINDAIERYRNYTQGGGQGSFGEFLSGALKSAGKGVAAGASAAGLYSIVKQLPQLLQNPAFQQFFNSKPGQAQGQQQQTAQGQTQQTPPPPPPGAGAQGGQTPPPQPTPPPGAGSIPDVIESLTGQQNQPVEEEEEEEEQERPHEPPTEKQQKQLKKDAASAVVRRMTYNPDDGTLKVIFNNNSAYNYYDVPEDAWTQLSEGQATAKTNGQNEFGVWWSGKNPSVGAALNKYIKKPEYIYEKIDDVDVTQDDMDDIIQEIKAKVAEYKASPKEAKEKLFTQINNLRQVEANLRTALKKKARQ